MKIFNLGVIGGRRGKYLAELALKTGRVNIKGFVEIDKEKREIIEKEFSCKTFSNYKNLLNETDLDGIIIATPPNTHCEITCAFLKRGIPVYLEKPIATNLNDAKRILKTAEKTKVPIMVGFNCRYAPFWIKIKEIVHAGKIGEIISLEWKEVLSPYHWSTYCRWPGYNKREIIGNWLLEKCCHDIDLMNWIIESKCIRVSSFGNRTHFKKNKNLPKYCNENCPIEERCIFSAFKFHPELKEGKKIPDYELLCVYNSNSDLVDHQSTILEYENGVTCCFSLMPLIQEKLQSRFVYICGTEGTLMGDWTKNKIVILPHKDDREIVEEIKKVDNGHGGGDYSIISSFIDYLEDPTKKPKTGIKEGWETMVICDAIDRSLNTHKTIELKWKNYM